MRYLRFIHKALRVHQDNSLTAERLSGEAINHSTDLQIPDQSWWQSINFLTPIQVILRDTANVQPILELRYFIRIMIEALTYSTIPRITTLSALPYIF